MNKNRLKEVQLDILREIKRICDENKIQFFLDYGTLIGAVRHKGMIPWDDDIDLGMRQEDYEKFCAIAPEKLKKEFYFQSWDNDKGYALPFSKVRRSNTHFIERTSAGTGQSDGIFVDIFPYDNYPESKVIRFFQRYCILMLNKLLLAKCGYRVWNSEERKSIKKITYKILGIASKLFLKNQLCTWYKKIEYLANSKETRFYLAECGDGKYERWKLPKECIDGVVELEFENEFYSCPQNYDLHLRCFYDDYMKLPPIEERISMHNVIKIIIHGEEV